jgi:hypothetical protein
MRGAGVDDAADESMRLIGSSNPRYQWYVWGARKVEAMC